MSRISHALSIIRSLPATPFRPPGSPQLSDALESIITRSFPSASLGGPSTPSTSTVPESGSTQVVGADSVKSLGPGEERALDGMIGALERIQSNQSLRDFPLGNNTSRPPHDPYYFKRMVDGVHLAQKGQGRSWWRRFFQIRGEA